MDLSMKQWDSASVDIDTGAAMIAVTCGSSGLLALTLTPVRSYPSTPTAENAATQWSSS
jgi:hypothetical protein